MKIREVSIKDFMALESAEFSLADQGLVLLQGVNEDDPSANSNGSGKSTLVEAVSYVIYGTTARGVSGDAVIRNDAKEARGTLVLEDEDAGETWRITRRRKKGKGSLKVEKDGADHTLGTEKLTQALVEKIMGCSERVFRAAVYIGQESLVDLPALTDKALKELVEEAAGVDILEAAYARARERANQAERALLDLKAAHAAEKARLDAKHEQHTQEAAHEARFETERGHSISICADLREMALAEQQRAADQITVLPARHDLEDVIGGLDARLASFAGEQGTERALSKALAEAERERDRQAMALRTRALKAKQLQADLAGVEGRVGEACSACGTLMDASHLSHAKAEIAAQIATERAALASDKRGYDGAQSAVAAARDALQAFRAGMSDPSALQAERTQLADKLSVVEALERVWAEKAREAKRLGEDIDGWSNKPNPHTANLKTLGAQIEALCKELHRLGVEIDAADDRLANETAAAQVFGPAGVRAHILDEVTPFLNERTSDYLGTLSDGQITAAWTTLVRNAKGELREKFAVEVAHATGGQGFAALSGGEKRKVRLACALALQDLVASRATKPIRAFFADEVDTALDVSGLERLMDVMNQKARERGTVVVVSHAQLRDWISNCWTVVKRDGKSELSL